jgi:hypothetical protein
LKMGSAASLAASVTSIISTLGSFGCSEVSVDPPETYNCSKET